MSANTYKPQTNVSLERQAIPAASGLQLNQPVPASLRGRVERQPVNHINSPNPAGGRIGQQVRQ